jgi:tetratricopeptide (TPR) repeat protein
MGNSRIDILKNMLEQDPANSFARYGVAMEYLNSGQLDLSVAEFQKLIEANPDYVAAYFHGGQTLEKLGKTEEARAIYRGGLEACARTRDAHTRSEIQAALDLL